MERSCTEKTNKSRGKAQFAKRALARFITAVDVLNNKPFRKTTHVALIQEFAVMVSEIQLESKDHVGAVSFCFFL